MPKADATARAVLGYLAVKADSNGRNAFPLALSIAHDVGLNPESVPRVLKRLVDYGLISKDGVGPQGQPRWVLHMERQHAEGSFDAFCLRHRAAASTRKARYRKGDVHDSPSGTVHDANTGTVHDGESRTDVVHDDASSCPGSSVVMSTTQDPDVHDANTPQKSPTKVLDQSGDQSTASAEALAPDDSVVLDAEIVEDDDGVTGLFDAPAPTDKTTAKPKRRSGRPKRKLNAPLVTRHGFPEPARHVEPGEAIRLIVGLWVDTYRARGVDPAGNTRGQAASEITALIDVGNNPNLVAAAAKRAAEAGYATVIREVERMVNGGQPAGRRNADPLAHLAPGDQNQCRFELMKTRPNWDKLATYGVTPAVAAQLGYVHASQEESA